MSEETCNHQRCECSECDKQKRWLCIWCNAWIVEVFGQFRAEK